MSVVVLSRTNVHMNVLICPQDTSVNVKLVLDYKRIKSHVKVPRCILLFRNNTSYVYFYKCIPIVSQCGI